MGVYRTCKTRRKQLKEVRLIKTNTDTNNTKAGTMYYDPSEDFLVQLYKHKNKQIKEA